MRHRSEWIVVISLVAGAGCGGGEIAAPTERALQPSFSYAGGVEQCGNFNNDFSGLGREVHPDWPCGAQIQVVTTGSGNVGALQSATGDWNSAFDLVPGMPHFVSSSQSSVITISGSTASNVNGVWSGTRGGDVNINLAPASGSGSGLPAAIAIHELGHIMGLGNNWDGGGYRTTGVSDHCSSSATGPGGTYSETNLCQHLVETFLYLYGARSTSPNWSKHIATRLRTSNGSVIPSSLTLTMGSNGIIEAGQLQFDRANPAFCALYDDCIAPAPANSIDWHTTSAQVVSVSNSGNGATLTPTGPGTAALYATLSSSTYELSSLVPAISITVNPAPPPPPSNVTANSITSNSVLIGWSNGDPLASTVLEYQHAGQGGWTQVTVPAGDTSKMLMGLQPSTLYSVRLHHVRDGVSGSFVTMTELFQTLFTPLEVSVIADHMGPEDEVGTNQTCRWKAFSNLPGATWTWQRGTITGPKIIWKNAGTSQIVSVATGTQQFGLRVTGAASGQSDTYTMVVDVASSGPICGAW